MFLSLSSAFLGLGYVVGPVLICVPLLFRWVTR